MQWLLPPVARLTPIRVSILPLLTWRIQQQLRQELVAKCQGLLPPPVVFTSPPPVLLLPTVCPCCLQPRGASRLPPVTRLVFKMQLRRHVCSSWQWRFPDPRRAEKNCVQFTRCGRTSVCTHLFAFVPECMNSLLYILMLSLCLPVCFTHLCFFFYIYIYRHMKEDGMWLPQRFFPPIVNERDKYHITCDDTHLLFYRADRNWVFMLYSILYLYYRVTARLTNQLPSTKTSPAEKISRPHCAN